ncbi:hypothetical protein LCGC14_2292640 [marine sediment metagenome]|uniref:Uncharacterized protein n=1 Tax=marine sediment metagenome TaxID=412755 RepID=A0A0F9FKY4_9ZZZZ
MVSKTAKRPRAKKKVAVLGTEAEGLPPLDWYIPGYLMEMIPDPAPAPEVCPNCGGRRFIERVHGLIRIACVECTEPKHITCPISDFMAAREMAVGVLPAPGEITAGALENDALMLAENRAIAAAHEDYPIKGEEALSG